jgi:hypothetical protein
MNDSCSFERYDKDLSGDIPSTDLKYLLQVTCSVTHHHHFHSFWVTSRTWERTTLIKKLHCCYPLWTQTDWGSLSFQRWSGGGVMTREKYNNDAGRELLFVIEVIFDHVSPFPAPWHSSSHLLIDFLIIIDHSNNPSSFLIASIPSTPFAGICDLKYPGNSSNMHPYHRTNMTNTGTLQPFALCCVLCSLHYNKQISVGWNDRVVDCLWVQNSANLVGHFDCDLILQRASRWGNASATDPKSATIRVLETADLEEVIFRTTSDHDIQLLPNPHGWIGIEYIATEDWHLYEISPSR